MSVEGKNIDQLFSEAAKNTSTPQYNDMYWTEMNSLLNARDKRRKRFLVWMFSGVFTCSFLIALLFFNNHRSTEARYFISQTVPTSITKSRLQNRYSARQTHNIISKHNLKHNTAFQKTALGSSSTINFFANVDGTRLKPNHQSTQPIAQDYSSINPTIYHKDLSSKTKANNEFNPTTVNENSHSSIEQLKIRSKNKLAMKGSQNRRGILKKIPHHLPSKVHLFAQIGVGVMENYATKNPLQSGAIDLSIRIEYNLNHLTIRSGIGIQTLTNIDLIVSKRKQAYLYNTSYSPSISNSKKVINYQTNLSYQNLYDLYLPIEFGYTLKKNTFGIGLQGNYLVGTTMKMYLYKNHILSHQKKIKGRTAGLNRISAQGYLWFEHRFTNFISLGGKIGTTLTSRLEDGGTFFNNSATSNPIYGQVTLKFKLH